MIPILFSLGNVKVYTYGIFLILAFFWGLFFTWKTLRLTAFKEEVVFDGIFFSLLGATFFARLFYVMVNFSEFGFSFFKFILINGYPGLSLYGAYFGGVLFFFLFCLLKKLPFTKIIDYLAVGVFVALFFGKLGAFFSGSEVGVKTGFPLAIEYIGYSGKRHLVAFYEALFFLIGSFLSYKVLFKIRREELFEGGNFLFLIWYTALVYILFDSLKENKMYVFGLSLNFLVSAFFLLTSSLIFGYHFKFSIISFLKKRFKNVRLHRVGKIKGIRKKTSEKKGGDR